MGNKNIYHLLSQKRKQRFNEMDIAAAELPFKQEEARKALGNKWIAAPGSSFRTWNRPDALYEFEFDL